MAGRNGIILLGQNLFFQGRVEAVAAPMGYRVRQAQTEADFWADYADGDGNGDGDGDGGGGTALVLVDLEGDADTWAAVLTGLQRRAQPGAGGRPTVNRPTRRPHSSLWPPRGHGVNGKGPSPGLPPDPEQGPFQRNSGGNYRRRWWVGVGRGKGGAGRANGVWVGAAR